jgi:hypothetical protein
VRVPIARSPLEASFAVLRRGIASRFAELAALLLLGTLFGAGTASAQQAHIQISEGPYYQGEPIDVHLVVEDFDEDPTPTVDVNPPPDANLKFSGVHPSVQSSISIVNGRMSQTKSVRFVYQYKFVSNRPGRFRVGPFKVSQGNRVKTAGPVQFEVKALGKSDRVRIDVSWPDEPVYPGQRIPVEIEWAFDMTISDRLHSYRIEVPVFGQTDSFRFIDSHPGQGDTALTIETPAGQASLKAEVAERVEKGRRVKIVKAVRTMIPLGPGEYDFEGPSVMVEEVVRWSRNLFGQRTPQSVRKIRAIGDGGKLVVLDVPKQGRPGSYAGAIGRGFSLDVSANRSVLQVGDPIELTIVLRGDGNLEGAGLPPLSAEGALSSELFRSPANRLGGVVKDGAKTFVVPVRVLDASIREIPPIPYSYFDSDKREYVTVHSRPIALSVKRGQLVTAADVVSNTESAEESPGAVGPSDESGGGDAVPAGDARSATGQLILTGANLSIVREPELLLASPRGGSPAMLGLLYGGSIVVFAVAAVYRRRSDRDPVWVERRKRFADERRKIEAAAAKPRAEAMAEFSSALRAMLKESPETRPGDLDAFLAECDAVAYAPPGSTSGVVVDADLDRARDLARQLEEGR